MSETNPCKHLEFDLDEDTWYCLDCKQQISDQHVLDVSREKSKGDRDDE